MKTNKYAIGPLLLSLLLLSACATTPPSPAPRLIEKRAPAVTRCALPAVAVRNNGDLNTALDRAEAAWAECAAQVDMIVDRQQKAARDE